MAIKDFVDFSLFTDAAAAFDLYSNSIRKGFSYDAYGDKRRFRAVVLNDPIPLRPSDVKYFNPETETETSGFVEKIKEALDKAVTNSDDLRISKFTFKARIIGPNSPHLFLPDPCDPTYADKPEEVQKLIALHTTFISNEDMALQVGVDLPRRGSIVEVLLNKNIFGYDLQKGTFLNVVGNDTESSAEAVGANCEKLEVIFNNSDDIGNEGDIVSPEAGEFVYDVGDIVSPEAGEFVNDVGACRITKEDLYKRLIKGWGAEYHKLAVAAVVNAEWESSFYWCVNGDADHDDLGCKHKKGGIYEQILVKDGRDQEVKIPLYPIMVTSRKNFLNEGERTFKCPSCSFGLWQFNICQTHQETGVTFLQEKGLLGAPDGKKFNKLRSLRSQINFIIKYVKRWIDGKDGMRTDKGTFVSTKPHTGQTKYVGRRTTLPGKDESIKEWVRWWVENIEKPADSTKATDKRTTSAMKIEERLKALA